MVGMGRETVKWERRMSIQIQSRHEPNGRGEGMGMRCRKSSLSITILDIKAQQGRLGEVEYEESKRLCYKNY